MEMIAARAIRRELPLWLRTSRVWLTYVWQHRRVPKLSKPRLFTELVQWRKLHDRDPRLPLLADKVAVKGRIARSLGKEWVIPTLWTGAELPEQPPAPLPLIVKTRHGCNAIALVFNHEDWNAARRRTRNWAQQRYGIWLDEWLYQDVPHGLIVEPFVGRDQVVPIDYKFFVFGGRVTHVQVHLDRQSNHRWVILDRDWHVLAKQRYTGQVARPSSLSQMITAAELLGAHLSFVRVDLYEVDGQPLFGELTFYPGSGLLPIEPATLDVEWGELWQNALALPQADAATTMSVLA